MDLIKEKSTLPTEELTQYMGYLTITERLAETSASSATTSSNMIKDSYDRPIKVPPVDPKNSFDYDHMDIIPQFDGKSSNFLSFIRLFDDVVGTTTTINEIKLICLKKKLDNMSRNLIAGIDHNYEYAYAILMEKYCDPWVVKQDVLKEMAELPNIEDPSQIDEMIGNLGIIRNRYYQLCEDSVHRDFLERELFYKICNKFPWVIADKSNNLLGKPERIHVFMKDVELMIMDWEMRQNHKTTKSPKFNNNAKECRFCARQHLTRECPMTIEERKQIIEEKNLCYRCLSENHQTELCPKRRNGCFNCGGNHSYLICHVPSRNNRNVRR
ncbi:uncharacterized protein LOC113792832 isoform X2 [Dermatophagoides pteronyssinus]|uniref:Uncharacterized protein LOC113792832 n=1 Tax=Dermatophagoides pteronyssinus TaxID=6956 RepID=A0A6P6XZ69_DERPT|nr:uncharacterized protein LOC113792832 [Dermatophagoides pteronyssinus]